MASPGNTTVPFVETLWDRMQRHSVPSQPTSSRERFPVAANEVRSEPALWHHAMPRTDSQGSGPLCFNRSLPSWRGAKLQRELFLQSLSDHLQPPIFTSLRKHLETGVGTRPPSFPSPSTGSHLWPHFKDGETEAQRSPSWLALLFPPGHRNFTRHTTGHSQQKGPRCKW